MMYEFLEINVHIKKGIIDLTILKKIQNFQFELEKIDKKILYYKKFIP